MLKTREQPKATPRVILILKQASSTATLHKTLAQKTVVTTRFAVALQYLSSKWRRKDCKKNTTKKHTTNEIYNKHFLPKKIPTDNLMEDFEFCRYVSQPIDQITITKGQFFTNQNSNLTHRIKDFFSKTHLMV